MWRVIVKALAMIVAVSSLANPPAMAESEEFKAVAFVFVDDKIKFTMPQYNTDPHIAGYAAQYVCQEHFQTECLIDNVVVAAEPEHAVVVNCAGELGFAASVVSIEDAEEAAAHSIGYAPIVCSIVLVW